MGGETHVFVDSRESLAVVLELRGEHSSSIAARAGECPPVEEDHEVPVSAENERRVGNPARSATGVKEYLSSGTESRGRASTRSLRIRSSPDSAGFTSWASSGLANLGASSRRLRPPFAVGPIF